MNDNSSALGQALSNLGTSGLLDAFSGGLSEIKLEVSQGDQRISLRVRGMASASTAPPDELDNGHLELKWSIRGHEVIAAIAEAVIRDENPDIGKKLDALFAADPETTLRGSELSEYAAWPDRIKGQRPWTRSWHYINLPFDGKNSALPPIPPGPHVLSELPKQIAQLSSSNPQERAEALSFVAHFVGDIHQPLHCCNLRNSDFPSGDRGGNDFRLKNGRNMHSLWDGAAVSNGAKLLSSTRRLRKEFPASGFSTELAVTEPEKWVWESHQLGREAYRKILAEPVSDRATPAYRTWARQIGRERATLGGYRLAQLLVKTL